jgi:hypothetical protein
MNWKASVSLQKKSFCMEVTIPVPVLYFTSSFGRNHSLILLFPCNPGVLIVLIDSFLILLKPGRAAILQQAMSKNSSQVLFMLTMDGFRLKNEEDAVCLTLALGPFRSCRILHNARDYVE